MQSILSRIKKAPSRGDAMLSLALIALAVSMPPIHALHLAIGTLFLLSGIFLGIQTTHQIREQVNEGIQSSEDPAWWYRIRLSLLLGRVVTVLDVGLILVASTFAVFTGSGGLLLIAGLFDLGLATAEYCGYKGQIAIKRSKR